MDIDMIMYTYKHTHTHTHTQDGAPHNPRRRNQADRREQKQVEKVVKGEDRWS